MLPYPRLSCSLISSCSMDSLRQNLNDRWFTDTIYTGLQNQCLRDEPQIDSMACRGLIYPVRPLGSFFAIVSSHRIDGLPLLDLLIWKMWSICTVHRPTMQIKPLCSQHTQRPSRIIYICGW